MTKLNKIARAMVITGIAQFSMSAFAADIGASQSITVSNETNVSQSSSTTPAKTDTQMRSNTSPESSTQVNAVSESTSMPEPNEPAGVENSTDGSIEDEPSNEEEENASSTGAEQASTSNLNVNNVLEIESVQTATSETLDRLSGNGNQLVADVSESFEGQLTSTATLASNTVRDTTLSAAADASTVINQTIQTTVLDSISSNTQSSLSESVNGQISTLVSEQINNEIAAAASAEVVNTISNDLDLGL